MSDFSDEDDQRKAESTSRMWAESQPGPSRCHPSRQGYCGYCRVLYSSLDQHLSSLRHLDSVQASSRGSNTNSFSSSRRTKLTLLERFLQDVLQHHPHHYSDPRPSHADLPSVSILPSPRTEFDEVCFSDQDSQSLGTREHLPSSDDMSCHLANQKEGGSKHSQSAERITDRLSAPVREQEARVAPTEHICSPQTQSLPAKAQSPSPVHKKAHRKSNRRKTSDSSSPPRSPVLVPDLCLDPGPSPGPGVVACLGVNPGPNPGSGLDLFYGLTCGPDAGHSLCPPLNQRPWQNWQKQQRDARKEKGFFSDHRDNLNQTIEEVIQMCCSGISSTSYHKEETDSLHFSLPTSMETQSEEWDSPVQVVFQPPNSFAQGSQTENLSWLMDVQVPVDDQIYSSQLESALNQKAGGGVRQDLGFWTLPIEQVLPVPKYIPDYFRGKTWTQIEQEDEDRVEKLVCQFRRGTFICYFDSESLARYGMQSRSKKGCGNNKEAESDPGVLPLLDCKDDSVHLRRRRGFRLASRCQVVKVSHSTQTVRLVLPTLCHLALEAPPPSVPVVNEVKVRWTPETWRFLPRSYSSIVTPVQPQTSLVYLLCSPTGPATTDSAGPSPRRCRKRRRPLDLQRLKVKYRPLTLRFYDPSTNRIIKTPPKGSLWHRGPTHSSPPPPCVRQLFRSLSPDLNADRLVEGGAARGSRVKGQKLASQPFSFLLGTLSRTLDSNRRRGRTSEPLPPQNKSERLGKRAIQSLPYTRKTRAQTTSQPRRQGLRPSGPGRRVTSSVGPNPLPSTHRQGRGCRRRGSEKGRK